MDRKSKKEEEKSKLNQKIPHTGDSRVDQEYPKTQFF